jgi:hypothetical protein
MACAHVKGQIFHEAKALFEDLRAKRPEEIGEGLLRTLQRRGRRWRLMK